MVAYFCDCSSNNLALKSRNYSCGSPHCTSCLNFYNYCDTSLCQNQILKQTEKHIQNQVGVSESQYVDVKSAISIGGDLIQNKREYDSNSEFNSKCGSIKKTLPNYPYRNLSDRSTASKQPHYVPSRGYSSVHSSVTSNKPGSMVPGGTGVDVKHGSYARYLGKLKAPIVANSYNNAQDKQTVLNKRGKVSVVTNNKSYRFSLVNNKCSKTCS